VSVLVEVVPFVELFVVGFVGEFVADLLLFNDGDLIYVLVDFDLILLVMVREYFVVFIDFLVWVFVWFLVSEMVG